MLNEVPGALARFRLPANALLASLSVLTGLVIGGASYQHSRLLIEQSQEQVQAALAEGLVVALSDQLVINDYAGMESRLQQAMADPSLASALVTDPSGRVLVHLQRERPEAEPVLLFEPARLAPPSQEQISSGNGANATRWTSIDAGMEPLGWLRLRTWSTSTDAVLALLTRQYLLLGVLAASLVGTLVVSAQQQIHRQSRQRERLLQQEKAELERKALTDPLTGVWNRRGVERALQAILDHPQNGNRELLAVCMIDLDDFKPVNDTYGHGVGDQLLIAVSRRLNGLIREHDLVGRIGGDEFIIVFRNCSEPEIGKQLATRIVIGLKAPFIFEHLQVRAGASIGIALNAKDANESMHSLLQRADQAMYAAKQSGKGHLVIAEATAATTGYLSPPASHWAPPSRRADTSSASGGA